MIKIGLIVFSLLHIVIAEEGGEFGLFTVKVDHETRGLFRIAKLNKRYQVDLFFLPVVE